MKQVLCGRITRMQLEKMTLPKPPGLVATLAAGFDKTANHVGIILMPILLDVFLWLGPRLQLEKLMQPVMDQLASTAIPASASLPDAASLQVIWSDFLTRFNLFGLLRTFPLGVSSLMSAGIPEKTPFSTPQVWQVSSFTGMLAGWSVIVICGWLLGSLYYYWVSGVSLAPLDKRSLGRSLLQSALLSLTWLVLALMAGLPVVLGFSLLALLSPALAQVGIFIVMLIAIWIMMPVFFSPHGLFTYQQNAFASILQSLRLARFTLPTSGLFLMSCLLISEGLGYLWRIPPGDSWLTLVGIIGHAFITTSLLAASFIYYRDVNLWLQVVIEQLKNRQKPVSAG